jgi:hypothetical protein
MPLICYKAFNFKQATKSIIHAANDIIHEYAEQGFQLTLRQLFYQFVARDLIPNTQRSYKRLGSIVNDGRLAGMIDWDAITDRTRAVRRNSHWDNPGEIVDAAVKSYTTDKWEHMENRVEVWIEKDALVDVIAGPCSALDVAFFSCRGYVSQSEMWAASQRLLDFEEDGYETHILHLGDHDPSGIDMTRDIQERLELFESTVRVHRIALTSAQIEEIQPPPNPAKTTDSRYLGYISEYGEESWELDALEPAYIVDLITREVLALRDEDTWEENREKQEAEREILAKAAKSVKRKLTK